MRIPSCSPTRAAPWGLPSSRWSNINTLQVTAVPDSKELFAPLASADGRYIAGASVDSQKLMLFDLATRKWSELLKMSVGWTTWSHDCK